MLCTASANFKKMNNNYHNLGGTIRAKKAGETYRRILPIAEKIGVTRVANVTGLDYLGIPVAIAIRPDSQHLSVSQGKGSSILLAKVSALMESIELWHAENLPPPGIKNTSYAEQAANRKDFLEPLKLVNKLYSHNNINQKKLDWLEAIDLMSGRSVFVPRAAVSLNSVSDRTIDSLLFNTSSNGLASGNTQDEALCHALYEVIERDAFAKWRKKTKDEQLDTCISIETITSPLASELLKKMLGAKIEIDLYNITASNGLPSFVCIIHDQDITRGINAFLGKGTHYDKEVALLRAITEAAQVRLTLISGSRDDVSPGSYYKNHPFTDKKAKGELNYETIPQSAFEHDFSLNIKMILKTLSADGVTQLLRVNLEKPEIGLPVVKLIAPELRS